MADENTAIVQGVGWERPQFDSNAAESTPESRVEELAGAIERHAGEPERPNFADQVGNTPEGRRLAQTADAAHDHTALAEAGFTADQREAVSAAVKAMEDDDIDAAQAALEAGFDDPDEFAEIWADMGGDLAEDDGDDGDDDIDAPDAPAGPGFSEEVATSLVLDLVADNPTEQQTYAQETMFRSLAQRLGYQIED